MLKHLVSRRTTNDLILECSGRDKFLSSDLTLFQYVKHRPWLTLEKHFLVDSEVKEGRLCFPEAYGRLDLLPEISQTTVAPHQPTATRLGSPSSHPLTSTCPCYLITEYPTATDNGPDTLRQYANVQIIE